MGCSRKGSSKMKTKLFFSLLLLAVVVAHGVPATAGEGTGNSHTGTRQSLVIPAEEPTITTVPTGPRTAADDPKQVLQEYDSLMIALSQKFSATLATLATIAEAAKRGEISSEQARKMSAEQYQLTHKQFELLSLWRGFEAQDLSRVPDFQPNPDPGQESDAVTVALPFSSLQLNPSLAKYLNLTPTQVEAIRQVMTREQGSFEPLMTELRVAREKLVAIAGEHKTEKQVKAVADTEASLLARLIVTNARMQFKIYQILSPDQQKKFSDLERTQSGGTSGGR